MKQNEIMQIRALARFKNKQLLKGEKADIFVCSLVKNIEDSVKTNCEECGKECYYIDKYCDNKDLLKRKHKKICTNCALKHEDIDPETRKLLEMVVEKRIYKRLFS